MPAIARRLPLLIIALTALLGAFLLRDQITFEALARHSAALQAFRDSHYFQAVALFILAYAAIVTFSLPGATAATLTGGFLFGTFPGVIYNVTGATIGATLLFLAARSGLGDRFAARVQAGGGTASRLQAALQENEWSALFVMRLLPVVPFFLANLMPAFAGVRLVPFVVTTFFGIIPAGIVFTSIGAGLQEVIAKGEAPDLSIIGTPQVLGPLLGLAALAALPMIIKALRQKGARG